MAKFSVERFAQQTIKNLKDERWRPLIISLAALSTAVVSYKAYSEYQSSNLGEDDLFPDFTSTLQQMIAARKTPDEVFYYLPETRTRAQLLIGASQTLGNRRLIAVTNPPLIHGYEWELLGGISLQQITLDIPETRDPDTNTLERVRLHALVGRGNSLGPTYFLQSPEREADIDRIVAQYPAGARALAARDKTPSN